ncbi:class I SAM-dependent methyltransferase [Nocardioides guangzhouensis]|uniref:Class I SAM-dependent methyltransferase n=1 Tax=Nocardioides guangzhouensis TaxID=2497878 RepID=A0A4V1XZV2_9ACTN|nr:class I SAM-dependent methyltransferase [Nocardioides guangzhouensis]RYP88039.1 class I SAM-dependent methyltransferase [Nocardioides guangzhouensis]
MRYTTFLAQLHALLEPRAYLEIGIRNGMSLSLARCPAVGVDPAYRVTAELSGEVHLHRTTSDEFFAREKPLAALRDPVDLAFIDGLHLFEFALRDLINTERHCSPASVIVFDDVLPRTVDEAARQRHTSAWTGDVYSVIPTLQRHRPDVTTVLVDTQPTGLMLVLGLDPADSTLVDEYDAIMAEFRRPDPQPVPRQILERSAVHAPERILEAGFWSVLREQRNAPAPDFHRRLREQLAADLGEAYAPMDN